MTTAERNPLPPIPAPDSSIRAFSAGELHAYHSNQAIAAYGDARAAHARKVALEEAAKVCESEHVGKDVNDECDNNLDASYNLALRHAAEQIRSMK